MNQGRVKWWNDEKGYGFIQTQDGMDLFVHHTAVMDCEGTGRRYLTEGEEVCFDISRGQKGPQADNVKKLICLYKVHGDVYQQEAHSCISSMW